MSAERLEDLPSDSSDGSGSRTGSWIVWLLHPMRAIPLVVILLLLSAPLVFRSMRLSRVPPAEEPFDTKPVLAFVVPDADNAFVEYQAASSLRVEYTGTPGDPKRSSDEFDKAQTDGWDHATEPVRKWLTANRPFMELWRKGTEKPDAQYCRASELRADTSLLSVTETREFSRLVRLEASRLLVEGNPEEAWGWLQTSFRMSRHLGRHGVMMERLVGVAIHSLTSEGMVKWANDSQVPPDLLRQAMRELQAEQQRTPPLSACLQTEYLSVIANWRSLTFGPANPTLNALTGESELNERVFQHVFANWLRQADKPRQERTKTLPGLFVFEPDAASAKAQPSASELSGYIHSSAMAALMLSSGQSVFTAVDREVARDRVLLTVLALELFVREHGQYPEKLEELVPDFLSAVPEDTHAPPKTPLRYRRDAEGALIYSVGENGLDDGGVFEKAEDIGYRIGKPRETRPK